MSGKEICTEKGIWEKVWTVVAIAVDPKRRQCVISDPRHPVSREIKMGTKSRHCS